MGTGEDDRAVGGWVLKKKDLLSQIFLPHTEEFLSERFENTFI